jgi:hypothetical protein
VNYLVNFQPVQLAFSGQFSTGVNTTGPQFEAIVPRIRQQTGIPSMPALAKGMTFNHDTLGIIK